MKKVLFYPKYNNPKFSNKILVIKMDKNVKMPKTTHQYSFYIQKSTFESVT